MLAAFGGLAGGLALESLARQRALERRHAEATVTGDRNGWRGLAAVVAEQLRGGLPELAGQEGVVRALAAQDPTALAAAAQPLAERLGGGTRAAFRPEVDVATAEGRVLYTTRPGKAPIAGADLVEALRLATGQRPDLLGPARTTDGDYLIVAAVPVHTREGLSGLVASAVPAEALLSTLEAALDARVAIVSPEGTALRPGRAPPFPAAALADLGAGTPDHAEQVEDAEGRLHHRVVVEIADLFGRPIGQLVTLRDITASQQHLALISGLSYGALAAAVLLLVGFLQHYLRHALRPLGDVVRVLDALAHGRRDVAFVAPRRRDEVGRLAGAVQAFRDSLAALEEARAANERMEGELAVAREIQLKMVPSLFPAFADRTDFRLHAILEPAKAVGGDLYDFFLVDDRRLFFVIGDVSDKGVASALYMATVRTVFRVTAQTTGLPLVEIVATVNRFLVENNPSAMFVTVFAGFLDTGSGEVEYCDGGHEPPFVRRGGSIEFIDKVGGLALGVVGDYPYRSARIALAPGDTLVLYTDGVSEAMDPRQEMFSRERIRELLADLPGDAPPERITAALLDAVQAFADGAAQSDDITVLALQTARGEATRTELSLATRPRAKGEPA